MFYCNIYDGTAEFKGVTIFLTANSGAELVSMRPLMSLILRHASDQFLI